MSLRNEVVFGNVNDDVRFYFEEFGTQHAHKSMCKVRMRVIFNHALQQKGLTIENKASIMKWHNQNPI